jgi:hypothetical protein
LSYKQFFLTHQSKIFHYICAEFTHDETFKTLVFRLVKGRKEIAGPVYETVYENHFLYDILTVCIYIPHGQSTFFSQEYVGKDVFELVLAIDSKSGDFTIVIYLHELVVVRNRDDAYHVTFFGYSIKR